MSESRLLSGSGADTVVLWRSLCHADDVARSHGRLIASPHVSICLSACVFVFTKLSYPASTVSSTSYRFV